MLVIERRQPLKKNTTILIYSTNCSNIMVILLNGNSEYVANVWNELFLLKRLRRCKQTLLTDLIANFSPKVSNVF